MEKFNIGNIYTNTQGYNVVVKEVLENNYFIVKFLENDCELKVSVESLRKGTFKNPYVPSVVGIGYLGYGKYGTRINNKPKKSYITWKHMIERAYDKNYHALFPTYINVTVCSEWHNFQNFAEWFENNYIEGYHLDKDLMQIGVGNKVYSPTTCLFVPSYLNSFILQLYSSNTSGSRGVTWDKPSSKWMVTIFDSDRKVNKNLGRYKDKDEAIEVYNRERSKIAEVLKNKIRELNYLPEEIIQLIK